MGTEASVMNSLIITASIIIPPSDFVWEATRASGPGGQNVNKVSSKVELRFNLPGTAALSDDVKARLRARVANRLDAKGWLMVASQATRDQSRNLEDAMERMRAFIVAALVPPTPRRATRPSRAAKARRLDEKRHQSERKRERTQRGDE
jgi:ribosome-associated protein